MEKAQKDQSKVAGAIARKNALTPEQRREIAEKAAAVRWGVKPIRASHKGNFKEKFGVDVECYVLEDAEKTAVISQTGMARALGLASRGSVFPKFIASQAMADSVGTELRNKVDNPLKFQWGSGGTGAPPTSLNGFEAGILIDICNAIIAAEASGKLKGPRYQNVTQQAHILVGASAKSGIRQLVYALAGYNPTVEEVIAAFKAYVLEEAKKYEPEFPSELYMHWHRLYNIPVPVRGKPWHFKYLTVRHIYHPLAQSSGKLFVLLKALKSADGDRAKKLFQFLNDIGARALRIQLGRVLEMAESSAHKTEYENKIVDRFGGQKELDLVLPISPSALPPPSSQSLPDAPGT
jgi:P63C domain